jgi:thiol-disulfide isomerase/thioredoxin
MKCPLRSAALGLSPLVALLVLTALCTPAAASDETAGQWNDASIEWRGFQDGMDRIAILGQPGILVFYTDWCPHCHNFATVFSDPSIVELAGSFVMIRVDADDQQELNRRFGEKGRYVPRTFFVRGNGEIDWDVHGASDKYPYFLDEHSPDELASLMRRVLQTEAANRERNDPRPASPSAIH